MKTHTVIVQCEHGLHARVAVGVVKVAKNHQAVAQLVCNGCRRADACSVLQLLTLGAGQGTQLQIVADGPDEDVLVEELSEVFETGSGI